MLFLSLGVEGLYYNGWNLVYIELYSSELSMVFGVVFIYPICWDHCHFKMSWFFFFFFFFFFLFNLISSLLNMVRGTNELFTWGVEVGTGDLIGEDKIGNWVEVKEKGNGGMNKKKQSYSGWSKGARVYMCTRSGFFICFFFLKRKKKIIEPLFDMFWFCHFEGDWALQFSGVFP